MGAAERAKVLIRDIAKADDDYYNKAKPTVSDAVYDAWRDELKDALPRLTGDIRKEAKATLERVDAPTVAVSEWKKVKHDTAMMSLHKVNTEKEFQEWFAECGKPAEMLFTEKLDGMSIKTVWDNGQLIQASTRGKDGLIGEDITVNVRKMKGIPKKLNVRFSGTVRGEVLLYKSDFKKHFTDKENVRNAASGISKRYDGEGVEHLTVMFYQIVNGEVFDRENEQFDYMRSMGLLTPPYRVIRSVQEIFKEFKRYQDKVRESLDYDIDGMVMRVNDMTAQFRLGNKGNRPRGAIAYKFAAPGATSVVEDLIAQVGNTGIIGPVAEFKGVRILGTTVTRASLYNYSYVRELDIGIGDEVLVLKANDIIPRVEEVIKKSNKPRYKPPEFCPSCGAQTVFNGEYLRCPNKHGCPAQIIGRLKIWIKENNILEWGDSVLTKLIDSGLVSDVADLYRLTEVQIAALDRMGNKSARKLIAILDKHRDVALENFVGGLGIQNVATSTTKKIMDAGYDSLAKMQTMTASELKAVEGFGDIRARAFVSGLRENHDRINDLLSCVTIKIKQAGGKLVGKSFAFTGTLSVSRKVLKQLVEDNGGDVKGDVGRGLDFLVTDDPDSGSKKNEQAKKLGTKVINEATFRSML